MAPDKMLGVSPRIYPSDIGGLEIERTIMGNATVAQELAGIDELDELYKLNATETEPEDGEENEEDGEEEHGGTEPEPDVGPDVMGHP